MAIWPVNAPQSQNYGENPTSQIMPWSPDYWIIQTYGNYQPNGHTGVDFSCAIGTKVMASTSGTVLHAGYLKGEYFNNVWWIAPDFAGMCLVIDHGAFIGIYGHLSAVKVKAGDRVGEGQVVALSGNTGASTGPHLHFEVLPDGWVFTNGMYGRVDPHLYITGLASLGDIIATIPEGTEMAFTIPDLLNHTAYTGGPSVSQVLKNVDQQSKSLYDAMFNGGKSMPGGLPLKDLIANGQRDLLSAVGAQGSTSDAEIADKIAAAIPVALVEAVAQALATRK